MAVNAFATAFPGNIANPAISMPFPPRSSRRSPRADIPSAPRPPNLEPRPGDGRMVRGSGACYPSPMPALILPLVEAAAHLPARGALIGLDLGTKTIGIAASDPDPRPAAGVETIARETVSRPAAPPRSPAAGRRAGARLPGESRIRCRTRGTPLLGPRAP